MKSFIKKIFIKICFALGFYPERLGKSEQFVKLLKSKPTAIQEYELNKIAFLIRLADDHKRYNDLLKGFVPEWSQQIKIRESKFIGKGIGGSSLDVFRKVNTVEGRILFEKIYFNSLLELKKNIWFQDCIKEHFTEIINVPEIINIIPGDLISIVYFNYVELIPLSETKAEESLIDVSKSINKFDLTVLSQHRQHLPESAINFKLHFQYQRGLPIATAILDKEGLDLNVFEDLAEQSEKVLCHGDLQATNIFQNNYVIDWDAFGFFPVGFEQAFLYFRLLIEHKKNHHPVPWFERYFKDFAIGETYKNMIRNFIYFLFVFMAISFDEKRFTEVEAQLLSSLKQLKN